MALLQVVFGFGSIVSNPVLSFEEDEVGKIENMIDNINKYLRNKGLPRLSHEITDIHSLFESALRSVWTLADKEQRDGIAVEIAQAIKPYYGGKKIEDALDEISVKLDAENKAKEKSTRIDSEKEAIVELEERMKNPDYVPTFEELMKVKKEGKQN
jgi:hypothetical protein